MSELCHQTSLFKLGYGPEDLTHHFGRRGRVREVGGSVYWNKFYPTRPQECMACQLNGQVSSKAARVLHQHNAHLVVATIGKQLSEPRSGIDWIDARDGRIIKRCRDLVATLGEGLDRFGLPTLAIFVWSNIGCAAGSKVGDCNALSQRHIVAPVNLLG
jgi:hypothetical protein